MTCDWGFCDEPAAALRLDLDQDGESKPGGYGWLLVCERHRAENPSEERPLDDEQTRRHTMMFMTRSGELDHAAMTALINDRQHWVFPWLNVPHSSRLCLIVEQRFYTAPDAAADYVAVTTDAPGLITAVCFAHKRRMSPMELGQIMVEMTRGRGATPEEWARALLTQDVVMPLTEGQDVPWAQEQGRRFRQWILDGGA